MTRLRRFGEDVIALERIMPACEYYELHTSVPVGLRATGRNPLTKWNGALVTAHTVFVFAIVALIVAVVLQALL